MWRGYLFRRGAGTLIFDLPTRAVIVDFHRKIANRQRRQPLYLTPNKEVVQTMSSEADKAPSAAAAMLNQPIVMDCGTATIKAGFAGGTKPKVRLLFH